MDNATKLLEEIRDLLRQHAEAAAADRAENRVHRELMDQRAQQFLERNRKHWGLYKRAVETGAVLMVVMLVILYWLISKVNT